MAHNKLGSIFKMPKLPLFRFTFLPSLTFLSLIGYFQIFQLRFVPPTLLTPAAPKPPSPAFDTWCEPGEEGGAAATINQAPDQSAKVIN